MNQFGNCFSFGAQGTSLKIHNGSGIKAILESSLDAMVVSMVAPQLDRFDLWVQPIGESSDDANVLGFLKMLAAPLRPLPTARRFRTSCRCPTGHASRMCPRTPSHARWSRAPWLPRRR